MVQIRVLGALEAHVADEVVDLGGPRQRAVLALLLVARGAVVSVDRLIDDLWRSEPPPRATGALQAYISNLRRAVEPDRAPRATPSVLVSSPPGYAVRLPTDAVDAWRFERLVRDAAAAPDQRRARALLEEAGRCWRGHAYAEVADEPWAMTEAARLEELRTLARERLVSAMLHTGAADEAVAEARALTREHPLREEGWRLLALALYRTGRQADALAALRLARTTLAEETGLDPGEALTGLEADILAQRPAPGPPGRPSGANVPGEPAAPAEAAPSDVVQDAPDGFVGREVELNALHAAARAAREQRLQIALVAGDAGAGKSALLNRFRRELAADGWRTPVGRVPEADGAPPGWAWSEALRELASQVDPGPHAEVLAPLLDDGIATVAGDVAYGRFRLHRAVGAWLAAAAVDRPLALVLDDVHRADSETLALLRGLADQLASTARILLVAAYRPIEAGPELSDTIAALARTAPTRLDLTGLEAQQAARLVRGVAGFQPDPQTLAALTDRTGGNPFYLAESARLLASEGALVAVSEVPQGVRDVLRRRFARLPELTVAILRLAAVIGREIDVEVLVRAAEVDEEAVLAALESGMVAGLLAESAPGSVQFGHVLVRDTLYADISGLRRSRWHARVAGALEDIRTGDLAALAYHYEQSASPVTARRAVEVATAAGDRAAARYAHTAACALYEQALAALDRVPGASSTGDGADSGGDLDERIGLIARLMRTRIAAGGSGAAAGLRREALALAARHGRDDLTLRILTAWDVPTPWLTRGYGMVDEEVVAVLERALRREDLSDTDRCRLLCSLVSETGAERPERSKAAAAEAVTLARRTGDPALIGLALVEEGETVVPDDEPLRRFEAAQELVRLGRQHALPACEAIGHTHLRQLAAMRGDVERFVEHLTDMQELVDRYEYAQAKNTITLAEAMLAHLRGAFEESEALYLRGAAAIRTLGDTDADAIGGLGLMTLRITQGRLVELLPMIRQMYERYGKVAADALALALVEQGDEGEARAVRTDLPPVGYDFFRTLFLSIRAQVVVALGDRDEAVGLYDDLLPYSGLLANSSGSFALGPLDTQLGGLARLLDRPEAAAGHYQAALALAQRCGSPPWADAARAGLAALQVAR